MTAIEKVTTLTIAVDDQEEALRWFVNRLDFQKRQDFSAAGMRWLTIAPRDQKEIEFVLASWLPDHVGKNAPCVVETRDCRAAYDVLKSRGVEFSEPPGQRPYGIEAVFHDPYGNVYALVERSEGK